MNSQASAANRGRLNSPRFLTRNPRASVPQAVMANDPRPRDPLAYPSSRPRPVGAARPKLSLVWSEPGGPAPVAVMPVKAAPVVAPVPVAPAPVVMAPAVVVAPVVVEAAVVAEAPVAVPQRMHLLRPLGVVSPTGKAVYVTSAFRQRSA